MSCNPSTHSLISDVDENSCSDVCGNINLIIDCKTIFLDDAERILAIKGENNSKVVTFIIPRYINGKDMSSMNINLNILNSNNVSSVKNLSASNITNTEFDAVWNIDSTITDVAGNLYVELEISNTDFIWKTNKATFVIKDSIK